MEVQEGSRREGEARAGCVSVVSGEVVPVVPLVMEVPLQRRLFSVNDPGIQVSPASEDCG